MSILSRTSTWPFPLTSRVCISLSSPAQRPVTGVGSSNGGPESRARFAPSGNGGAVRERSSRKGQRVQCQAVHPSGAPLTAGQLHPVDGGFRIPDGDCRPASVLVDEGGEPAWVRVSVTDLAGVDDGLRGRCLLLLAPACAPLSVSALGACPNLPPRSRSWAGEARRCRVSAAALLPGYVGYVRPAA